jgi:hypothetical protein
LGEKLNIKSVDEWYKVTRKDFSEHKGDGLLALYDRSVRQAITALMNDIQWEVWKFSSPKIRDSNSTVVNYMKYHKQKGRGGGEHAGGIWRVK